MLQLTQSKIDIKESVIYLSIIIFSILWSFSEFVPQTAVDGGLIISGEVKFPDEYSNNSSIYFNGWNTLHYIAAILLKFNFSQYSVSWIIIFSSILSLTIGIYYLLNVLTENKIFSLIISLIFILTQKHLGHVDYPTLHTSEHSYGMYTFSLFTLVVGLLARKSFLIAGIITTILIGFHLVVGLWVLFTIIGIFILAHIFKINLKLSFDSFSKGIFIGLVPIVLSLIFFFFNTIEKDSLDEEAFNTYMSLWDHHRNIMKFHINYVVKTSIMIFIILIFVIFFKNFESDDQIFIYFLLISSLFSSIVYILFKIYSNYFPELLVRTMPTRLIGLHSIIAYPLILGIIIKSIKLISKKYNINLKILLSLFFVLLASYYSFFHNEKNVLERVFAKVDQKLLARVYSFKKNVFIKKNDYDLEFWKYIRNLEIDGYVIGNAETSNSILRKGLKPYIINAHFIDHLPYHPYTVSETKAIIEEIYEIDFNNPPRKYTGAIKDTWYRNIFEKKSVKNWNEIAKKFNISAIILPDNWNIKLKKSFTSDNYSLYLF